MAATRRLRWRRRVAASVAVVAAALSLPAVVGSAAGADPKGPVKYYVSLGDSYSVGFQPSPSPGGATTGYTGVVAAATGLTLANFGCGGATSASILTVTGCAQPFGPPAATGAVAYPTQTQAAAAESFLRSHRGHVRLVTVTIGGNDVTKCGAAANPVTCLTTAVPVMQANVTALVAGLRAAAGPEVPIIGLTYPDVLLGLWVFPPGATNQLLAALSVTAFNSFINPALAAAYATGDGQFVDITAATGAYIALTQTTTLAPYGTIPVAVAQVCTLTWFCTLGNIHATTAGYTLIGQQVVAAFDQMKHA